MYAISTTPIHHRFSGSPPVLDGLELAMPAGSIYGFLGKNGAGKTTSLRLILGLLKMQQGQVKYFGNDFGPNRLAILNQIGSLIEQPSLYGNLTATENLKVWQQIYRCPAARISEVLSLVGLSDTGKKRVAHFSLGMKQRLSIAIALLHQPKLLILDEPTNGLDPEGIREMRELLRRLNTEEGLSILVSSHLLSEVEKLVTHVGILHQGTLAFQGPLKELQERQRHADGLLLRTLDNAKAEQALLTMGHNPALSANGLVLPPISDTEIAQLNALLVQQNIPVIHLQRLQSDLESIYLQILQS